MTVRCRAVVNVSCCQVGQEVSEEEAQEAARKVAIQLIASIKSEQRRGCTADCRLNSGSIFDLLDDERSLSLLELVVGFFIIRVGTAEQFSAHGLSLDAAQRD